MRNLQNTKIKAGTNVTMSGVNNIATTRGPNLFTKTDVDTYSLFKASAMNPTCTGTVTAPTLTAAGDATLNGEILQ